jgi:large subunit ribosomal protein L14
MLTKVKIIDNSGGIEARIIKILNKKSKLNIGSLVLVSILSNIPNSKVRKGQIYKALIVNDNSVNFSYNFLSEKKIILVKTKNNEILPVGSRIKGFISSKLKNIEGTQRILAITKRTI